MDTRIPIVCGIDALYYFAQSGVRYENFFLDLLSQLEDKKKEFTALGYAYQDNEIIVSIHDIDVTFSGAGRDGFFWFAHKFFRVGFKDKEKNIGIHNIRVQLNAVGIYTLGIGSLIEYINKELLKGITMDYFPVTRIDLNAFIQHDFQYLVKEMIVSKKKNHATALGERSSGYELETYYVGKKPFLLRIYNKRKELATASEEKRDLMHNYFGVNGLNIDRPIFNVEFELHREFLKQYGIDSIDQALERAESLFKQSCDLVRIIDPSTVTQKELHSSNRRRADTLYVWNYIQESYKIDAFLQVTTPLNKIEKISYRYTLADAEKPIKKIITRLLMHESPPTLLYLLDVLQKAKEELALRKQVIGYYQEYQKSFADELKIYTDEGLWNFEHKLLQEMQTVDVDDPYYSQLQHKYSCIFDELVFRGLQTPIPF